MMKRTSIRGALATSAVILATVAALGAAVWIRKLPRPRVPIPEASVGKEFVSSPGVGSGVSPARSPQVRILTDDGDALSHPLSVTARSEAQDGSDGDVLSRALTITASAGGGGGGSQLDAISRALVVTATSGDGGTGTQFDAISRALVVTSTTDEGGTATQSDAVARAVAVKASSEGSGTYLDAIARAVTVFAPTPNLTVPTASAPAEVFTSRPFEVAWRDQNTGEAAARPRWKDRISLSDDDQLGNDTKLAELDYAGALQSQEFVDRTQSVTIPLALAPETGPKFLIVETNVDGAIYEEDRSDNWRAIPITVTNPVPVISTITPVSVYAGSLATEVVVSGSAFVPTSTVTFDGLAQGATYISPTELRFVASAEKLATPGSYLVKVTNPAPGGGVSNSATFVVIGVPQLAIGSATVERPLSGNLSATVTLRNFGTATASSIRLTRATLASAGSLTTLPISLPNLGPGQEATVSLQFPTSILAGSRLLSITLSYQGGIVLATRKVAVP